MKYLFTITLACSIISSGCTLCTSKKISCPAFDEPEFLKWIPYKLNDTLHFVNQSTLDTVMYTIGYYKLSEAYETTQGSLNGSVGKCGAYANIYGYNSSPAIGQFYINYTIAGGTKQLYIAILNGGWNVGEVRYNSFEPVLTFPPSATINADSAYTFMNGITYNNFVTIKNDTSGAKEDKPYKLYIAKHTGIVGFEMYPSKQKWILQ